MLKTYYRTKQKLPTYFVPIQSILKEIDLITIGVTKLQSVELYR